MLFGLELHPDWHVFPRAEGYSKPDPVQPMSGWRSAWRSLTRAVNCPACGELQNPGTACQNVQCRGDLRQVKSSTAGLRFHDLRHHAITELAESQASDRTIISIAGHVSQRMLAHYSHVRIEAKRKELDVLAVGAKSVGYDTKHDTKSQSSDGPFSQVIEKNGGDDGTRTRGLCRDRRQVTRWHTQYQLFTGTIVGNRWTRRAWSDAFCSTVCSTLIQAGRAGTATPKRAPPDAGQAFRLSFSDKDYSGAIITPLMSLAPGHKLGPYEIVSPLGAGGMGEVYRAKDTRLERIVAIKILSDQLSKDPTRKQRFEREAKTISSLNHPHICKIQLVGRSHHPAPHPRRATGLQRINHRFGRAEAILRMRRKTSCDNPFPWRREIVDRVLPSVVDD